MIPKIRSLTGLLTVQLIAALMSVPNLTAQDKATLPATGAGNAAAREFNELADTTLAAMKQRAEELNIKGVALVAYAEGDTVKSWTSKMVVVGNLTTAPAANGKASNLLGIAYTKAAEMADTLKDSGSKVRPPMTGEYGYRGGLIARGKSGILIAAFSGGPDESDLKVSKTGLDILAKKL